MFFNKAFSFSKKIFSNDSKTKTESFWTKIFLASIIIAIFFSTILQAPFFVDRGLNTLSLLLWIVVLIVCCILDYKLFMIWLLNLLIFLAPFVLYCLVGLFFEKNYFSSNLFRLLFQAVAIVLIGCFVKQKLNVIQLKSIGYSFWISSLLLSLLVVVLVVLPSLKNILSPTYTYTSKNSTAPIVFTSAILAFFLSDKKLNKILATIYFVFITFFVFVVQCRTVLISIPFVAFGLLLSLGGKKPFFIGLIALFALILIVFLVPSLNELIIQKMILNNKTNIDDISSGRLSLIVENIGKTRFFFGTPGFYLDCMPISMIIEYGIFGFALLLPLVILPIYLTIKINNHKIKLIAIFLCITFYINCLLEGYGIFGPGNKTLVFWLFFGFCFPDVYIDSKISKPFYAPIKSKMDLINEKAFFTSALLLLSALSVVTSATGAINDSISDKILFRLDSNIDNPKYIYPEKVEFNEANRTTFCVGQTYSFAYDVYPYNATDKALHPLAWNVGSDTISFEISNDVTAHFYKPAKSVTLDVYSEKVKKARTQNYICIVDPNEFAFDDIEIWTSKGCELDMLINQQVRIEFDNNYIPSADYINYYSTDEDVAKVIDGRIVAVGPGLCNVYAMGANEKTSKVSNYIHVAVRNEIYSTPSQIECTIDYNDFFTKTNYAFSVSFDHGISDDYELFINGSFVGTNKDSFALQSEGLNIIKIQSSSNHGLYFEKEIDANKLEPLKFVESSNNWFIKKNGKSKINLFLKYNDGSTRRVESKDLSYSYEDFKNRASRIRSGTVDNDGLTFLPLKSGDTILHYICKDNNDIEIYITVTASSFSREEFSYISNSIGLFILYLLLFMGTIIFNLSQHRKKRYQFLILSVSVLACAILILVINHFYVVSVIGTLVFIAFEVAITAVILLVKRKKGLASLIPCENCDRRYLVCVRHTKPVLESIDI